MANGPNEAQRDFWSGPSGTSWIDNEREQDAVLAPVADIILSRAAPSPGERVLDIGCGTGALSDLMARAVGADGRVLATDISPPLLARAAERLAAFPHAATHLGDAETADWPETEFDIAVSRFGVMFFADPPAAFANIACALRPGARVVFAAWAPVDGQPYWQLPHRIAAGRLGQPPRVEPDTPGPFGLSTASLTKERLERGGFADVMVEPIDVRLVHPDGLTAFAQLMTKVGPARRVMNEFDASREEEAAIQAEIMEALSDFESGGRVAVPATINLITATTS